MALPIVYFGSGAFGVPTLARIASEHTLVGVVTQPDRPAGRGGKLTPTPVAEWCSANVPGVEVIKPEKVNVPEVVAKIAGWGAKHYVVIAYGQKIGKAILDGKFAINLHASLLPRWRGAAPINWAILAGDADTGNSVITLADKMDAGLVLGTTRRRIESTQTAGDLHDLLAQDGPSAVFRVLREEQQGSLMPDEQDEARVTLAGKLSRSDAQLDFAKSATECRCRINGLSPWPGVTVKIGDVQVKLLRAGDVLSAPASGEPGTIVDVEQGQLLCAERTAVQLLEVQPAGKRAMSWGEFVRGNVIQRGAVVANVVHEGGA